MRKIPRLMAAALTLALLLSLAGCGSSDGKTHLTFQIWDVAQRDGMQAMCDAYTAQVDPNVVIEVQVTNWSEYWTKLEAAAESNTMPDIYWMHTDQILYYADFGILADLTDLYADEDASYYQNHFPTSPSATPAAPTAAFTAFPRTRTTCSWSITRKCLTPPAWPTPLRTGPGTI